MAKAPVDRSVSAVDRTLAILDAFAQDDGVRSLTELEASTGLFKSVICRYMLSFERLGYIVKRADGRYQLGSQVMRLGRAFERAFDMSQHVVPLLQALACDTQESASFYVREGDMRLCLYRIESPAMLRVAIPPGTLRAIDESATGQVFSRFGLGCRRNPHTDHASFLRTSSNYTRDGVPDHVASASIPVFGLDNELAGAITVSGPMSRFDPETSAAARRALAQAAMTLSGSLGANAPYPEGDDWYLPASAAAAEPAARDAKPRRAARKQAG